jgi:protein O-GlcNAc transferase
MNKFNNNYLKPSQQQINNLLESYQARRYIDAEKLSISITQEFPQHPFAWKVLAAVLKLTGRLSESLVPCQKSVLLEPEDAEAHNNFGIILQELGRLNDAEESFRKAKKLKPNYAEAHSNLGAVLQELSRLNEAEESFRKAILLKPDYAEAHSNLGAVLQELSRLNEAEESFRKAILLKPDYAEAYYNLGITCKELGRLNEAEECYKQAILLKPDYAEAYSNLGITRHELGRLNEAEESFRKAILLKPDYAEAYSNLGATLHELSRLNEAEECYKQAILLKPDYAEAYSNLGITYKELSRLNEAEECYKQAILLKPDYAEAYSNLGITRHELGRLNEAEESYKQAILLKPDYAEAYSNLGITRHELGRLNEAEESFRKAIEIKANYSNAHNNRNLCLNYSSLWSPLFIYKQHLEFEKQFGRSKVEHTLNPFFKKDSSQRLRIGYVSADFKIHSVAFFFEPLLKNHNSHAVETFCYYNNTVVDTTTKRLMNACDHWRSIFGISNQKVINLIKNDKIDILVDLSGHTAGNRLLVFTQKPSPIQVTWLGYPNTTGLSTIDYRLTDIIADPIGEADELHSETLLRLPNGFQCYQANDDIPVHTELPQKRGKQITFGSLNNVIKITPIVIKTWSKILHSVPTSRLVLKFQKLNNNSSYYHDLFIQEGISKERIEFYQPSPSIEEHLSLYNTIDICLDPFPYNGATTTCEALWMGVPVITLLGDRHVGRVGASILTNIGLEDFIAHDINGYIELAVEMSANLKYLMEIKTGLRKRMQNAPLCDGLSFAKDFETIYQDMWSKYQLKLIKN